MELTILDWVYMALGGILSVLFVFCIMWLFNWIKRNNSNKIKANFIYDDRTIERKNYYNIIDKINYDDIDYEYDDNVTIKLKGIKNIFYIIGNQKPLDFHNPDSKAMTYADYKKIIKSKVLNDLLEDDGTGLTKGERTVLIVVIAVGLIVVGALWYFSQQPMNINLTPEVGEFIKQSVIEAIKS